MSKCISMTGEYSDHVMDGETFGSEFICSRCFAFDEDAAQAEIDRLASKVADAWDEGYVARLGDTPRYKSRAEWGNPYRTDSDHEG